MKPGSAHVTRWSVSVVSIVWILCAAACSTEEKSPTEKVPPTPRMPAGWTVVNYATFAGTDLAAISQSVGARLTALRNTTFEVDGMRVQVNVLVALDDENADAVVKKLSASKPAEFLLRKGLTVYEFVCKNDAIPHARAGRKHLASQ